MLSDMLCCEGGELTRKNFVFLDRHPFACIEILNAYRDGFVTQPPHVAVEVWQAELYAFEFHNCTNGPIEGLDKVLGVGNEPDMAELVVAAEGKPAKGTVRLQLWKVGPPLRTSTLASLQRSHSAATEASVWGVGLGLLEGLAVCPASHGVDPWQR